jgi:hypothetical protein
MAANVTATLHGGLAALFYVVARILHALQKKNEFNPNDGATPNPHETRNSLKSFLNPAP